MRTNSKAVNYILFNIGNFDSRANKINNFIIYQNNIAVFLLEMFSKRQNDYTNNWCLIPRQ